MKFSALLLIGTILLAGTNTVSAKETKKNPPRKNLVPATTSSVPNANPTPAPTGGLSNMFQGAKSFIKKEGASILRNGVDSLNSIVNPAPSNIAPATIPTPTPIADAGVTTQQPSVTPKSGQAIKRSIAKLLKFLA